jgi:hypothetical protein
MKNSLIFSLTLALLFTSIISGRADDEAPFGAVLGPPVQDKTDYIVVDSINYKTKSRYTADKARIFYTFQAARENPENKPVFVIFNGGPGAATTSNFFSMNTANYTLCKGFVPKGALNCKNPYAWTDMANLLYIDAPNTGFSYNQDVNLGPCGNRGGFDTYVTGRNFNPLIDAAQMVRAMLRALKATNVQKNQVVIVGESYGGVRATTMLHMLFFYNYSPILSSWYEEDSGLRDEIQQHYNAVFDADNKIVSPAEIAKQFGYNILIQPQLTGKHHRDRTQEVFCPKDKRGLLDTVAEERKIDRGRFLRCSDLPWLWRTKYQTYEAILACTAGGDLAWAPLWMTYNNIDPYNFVKPANWSDELDAFAVQSLTNPTELAKILGLGDMANFPELIHKRDTQSYHSGKIPALTLVDDEPDGPSRLWNSGRRPDFPDSMGMDFGDKGNFGWLFNKHYYGTLNGDALSIVFANAGKMANLDQVSNNLDDYYGPPPNCTDKHHCCDSYYKSWDMSISLVNYLYSETEPNNVNYGRMFLFNLAVLKEVMITNAANDFMIYSPTLPLSFKEFAEVSKVITGKPKNTFTIYYRSKALDELVPTPESRTIAWPKYKQSGHAVSSTQPQKLHDDIKDFLKKNNLVD